MNFIGPTNTVGIIDSEETTVALLQQALTMGFKVVVLTQDPESITIPGIRIIQGDYQEVAKLQFLFDCSDIVVYDSEFLHLDHLDQITDRHKLVQGTELLELVQDRYLEKSFLNDHNLNIVPYAAVIDDADLAKTVEEIGFPCILKPIQKNVQSLDGVIFQDAAELENYHVPHGSFVLESYLDIKQEQIVLINKDDRQKSVTYPIIRLNCQDRWSHTISLYQQNEAWLTSEIEEIAQSIAQNIDYQGLFAVKLCITTTDMLYVQRIYLGTMFEANIYQAVTNYSQEELFWRSVCNWPLPQVSVHQDACNLVFTKANLTRAIDLITQHPQWQLQYCPNLAQLNPYLGYLTVFGQDQTQLQHYINLTQIWQI